MGGGTSVAQQRFLGRLISWIPLSAVAIALASVFAAGCVDNFSIGVSGHVRNQADSAPVEGALVILDGRGVTTDPSGYYQFGGYSPEHETAVEVLLIVTDFDGEINGVFVSRDTLVTLDGTQHIQDVQLNIDFYVEMVDGGSGTGSTGSGGF